VFLHADRVGDAHAVHSDFGHAARAVGSGSRPELFHVGKVIFQGSGGKLLLGTANRDEGQPSPAPSPFSSRASPSRCECVPLQTPAISASHRGQVIGARTADICCLDEARIYAERRSARRNSIAYRLKTHPHSGAGSRKLCDLSRDVLFWGTDRRISGWPRNADGRSGLPLQYYSFCHSHFFSRFNGSSCGCGSGLRFFLFGGVQKNGFEWPRRGLSVCVYVRAKVAGGFEQRLTVLSARPASAAACLWVVRGAYGSAYVGCIRRMVWMAPTTTPRVSVVGCPYSAPPSSCPLGEDVWGAGIGARRATRSRFSPCP